MVLQKAENFGKKQNLPYLQGHNRVTKSTSAGSLLYFSECYIDLLHILGHYRYLNMN